MKNCLLCSIFLVSPLSRAREIRCPYFPQLILNVFFIHVPYSHIFPNNPHLLQLWPTPSPGSPILLFHLISSRLSLHYFCSQHAQNCPNLFSLIFQVVSVILKLHFLKVHGNEIIFNTIQPRHTTRVPNFYDLCADFLFPNNAQHKNLYIITDLLTILYKFLFTFNGTFLLHNIHIGHVLLFINGTF